MNETQVRITAKLYECRYACRRLSGDDYEERIQEYKDEITRVMGAWGLDVLPTVTKMAEDLDDDVTQWLAAAAVELIEDQLPTNSITLHQD